MPDPTETDGVKAARLAIYGDPDSSEFTEAHRRSLMRDIEAWYETIDAAGLSHLGVAALLRDIADDFG